MKINSVATNANRVRECLGAIRASTSINPHVGLQDREFRGDTTALAYVRCRSQAVWDTEHFRTEPQTGIYGSTVRPRSIGLQPTHKTEGQLPCLSQGDPPFRFSDSDERTQPVVDLRPVDVASDTSST
jgi:hypothetical protein